MPRRGLEIAPLMEPPRKKSKVLFEIPSSLNASLNTSFCDDEALPPGIVFTDIQQKNWKIGKPIGRGSFGRIYLASDEIDSEVTKQTARYVVKIEPHSNGPLFVEIHCLIRTAQCSNIKTWRQQKKLRRLGMPVYISSGSFTEKKSGQKYRFLILPRYDIDLQKIIARTRVLDVKNVCVLAIQILDVLEYLHQQGYTHSDIKSSNLMIGFDSSRYAKPFKTPSFQKDTKEVAVLSGKHRKLKPVKARTSNYYADEDFTIKDHKSGFNLTTSDKDQRLVNVKNKLRKILSDRDNRTLHRHHAFNLRQLSNCVNYEDVSSSVCSDQSYQRLLDDYENKQKLSNSSDEGFYDDPNLPKTVTDTTNDMYREAILSQSNRHIYLLDYGLASKFLESEGNHKDFGMDARKAHDGTLEYSSRDSHIGAHSRRSDLETLAFNLLDWLTGTLPWKTTEMLTEPDIVHALKKRFMSNIKTLLKTCFKSEYYPKFMENYLEYVTSLEFTDKPDYDYCRNIFRNELINVGCTDKEPSLNFSELFIANMNRNKSLHGNRFGKCSADFSIPGVKRSNERENIHTLENELKLELLKQTLNNSSDGIRKPCASRNFFISDADLVARLKKSLMPQDILGKKLSPKNLRSKKRVIKKRGKKTHRSSIGKFGNFMGSARQFTWAEILAGNPEDLLRKDRNTANNTDDEDEDEDNCKYRIRKQSTSSDCSDSNIHSPLMQKDYLVDKNPTYAMIDVIARLKNKLSGKEEDVNTIEGYTPAMVRVLRIKEKNEAKERQELLKLKAKEQKSNGNSKKNKTKNIKNSDSESVGLNESAKWTRNVRKCFKGSDKSTENVTEVDGKRTKNSKKTIKTSEVIENKKSQIKHSDSESESSSNGIKRTKYSRKCTKKAEKSSTKVVDNTSNGTKTSKNNTKMPIVIVNRTLESDTEHVKWTKSVRKCSKKSEKSTDMKSLSLNESTKTKNPRQNTRTTEIIKNTTQESKVNNKNARQRKTKSEVPVLDSKAKKIKTRNTREKITETSNAKDQRPTVKTKNVSFTRNRYKLRSKQRNIK